MPRPSKKRRHHFVPVCYQKAFGDSNDEVYVQFLNMDKPPKHLHPISVGVADKFYTRHQNGVEDDSIEDFFDVNIERLYAPIAKRARRESSNFRLTESDIPAILRFVSSQVVRTMAHRLSIDEQAGERLSTQVFVDNIGRKMRKIGEAWQATAPDIHLFTSLPYIGNHFITGDNPVMTLTRQVMYTGIDTPRDFLATVNTDQILTDPTSQFIVPLSPYLCLALNNVGTGQMFSIPEVWDSAQVSVINRAIYGQCVQFVEALDERSLGFHVRQVTPTLP